MTTIADLHERLGRFIAVGDTITTHDHTWDARGEYLRGMTTDATVRAVSPPPTDANPDNVARINADWNETDRLMEAARVEHGFCTPAYRKAVRAILAREPVRQPDWEAIGIDYPEGRN